ncbi:hypothetical protein DPMN_173049 [Dreissena polymorpha]|uniref:Uncharacterized protein n=1 Tax=Dreissena polymorpha TaxID=45954 RepID=A0A9D4E1Z0_DREPO|nr:hypothetical protein DPMN_173049 [Dreissena polymorpha]
MCQITAVAVEVENRARKFQLKHGCIGIAHHQGDQFICSGSALYKYSLSGKLVCRLWKDHVNIQYLGVLLQLQTQNYEAQQVYMLQLKARCSKMATLATLEDGVKYPVSVCYSNTTSSFIVGQWNSNNILVYRGQDAENYVEFTYRSSLRLYPMC